MANINKSGLYVVIKNVNQLKKTINIINTLKSGKEINMHFTSEEIEGEKKNFLKISEDGINDSVSIVIQHELYSDEDKFKCVSNYNTCKSYSTICVESKILYDIFKSIDNNYTVIFYIYLNESSLRISITNNSTFSQELKIATIDPNYDETLAHYKTSCCVMMNTKVLTNNIKLYNKFTEDLVLLCSNNSLSFESSTLSSNIESRTILSANDSDVIIKASSSITDIEKMIIKSTYPMKCMMLVTKIDDQFCEKVTIHFIPTIVSDIYAIMFYYSISKDEYIKITILPKNTKSNSNENNDQIEY